MGAIITLTTDFGTSDSYVAQMKGVILSVNPDAQVIDVTHAVPPQDVSRAADVLMEVLFAFPSDAIHVVVVDPGVGGDRKILATRTSHGRCIAPDNGILTHVVHRFPGTSLFDITESRFCRPEVSSTFHGRDIMAPVAAQWSLGKHPSDLGQPFRGAPVLLPNAEPRVNPNEVVGRIVWVDGFGNLIANIEQSHLSPGDLRAWRVECAGQTIDGISRTYVDSVDGDLVAIFGSSGRLEVAVANGNASQFLKAKAGAAVRVSREPPPRDPDGAKQTPADEEDPAESDTDVHGGAIGSDTGIVESDTRVESDTGIAPKDGDKK